MYTNAIRALHHARDDACIGSRSISRGNHEGQGRVCLGPSECTVALTGQVIERPVLGQFVTGIKGRAGLRVGRDSDLNLFVYIQADSGSLSWMPGLQYEQDLPGMFINC